MMNVIFRRVTTTRRRMRNAPGTPTLKPILSTLATGRPQWGWGARSALLTATTVAAATSTASSIRLASLATWYVLSIIPPFLSRFALYHSYGVQSTNITRNSRKTHFVQRCSFRHPPHWDQHEHTPKFSASQPRAQPRLPFKWNSVTADLVG